MTRSHRRPPIRKIVGTALPLLLAAFVTLGWFLLYGGVPLMIRTLDGSVQVAGSAQSLEGLRFSTPGIAGIVFVSTPEPGHWILRAEQISARKVLRLSPWRSELRFEGKPEMVRAALQSAVEAKTPGARVVSFSLPLLAEIHDQ